MGQKGSLEAKITAASGIQFASIQAGKFRRYRNASLFNKLTDLSSAALNIRDLGRFGVGVTQSIKIIRRFSPDVVFIKGGYVALPVGLAAGLLKIPYVVHESDVVPGLTNKTLSKKATTVATGFPVDKYHELPKEKLVFTGSPIRAGILGVHRLEGLAKFKLDSKLPVVLVMGGSLGAKRVNDAIIEALRNLTEFCQVIHITGERDIERVRFEVKRLQLPKPERYQAHSFLMDELGGALAAADVVISRAGANSIAELAALRKPTILVPASHLRDQETNAQVLARAGAVRVIPEARLSSQRLVSEVKLVLEDDSERGRLSEHIAEFAVNDAAEQLAKLILAAAQSRGE